MKCPYCSVASSTAHTRSDTLLVAPPDYTYLLGYHRSHDPYGAMIPDSFPFTSGPLS